MKKNKIIIISGPTATGKSQLGPELIREFCHSTSERRGAIFNFDSLCFYRELSIGSCKPSAELRKEVDHFLIDIASISAPLNAADFVRTALPLIQDQHEKNRVVFLVGGSGFYLQALQEGMYHSGEASQELRQKVEQLYTQKGIEPFLEILQQEDPESLIRLHPNDHYRIKRAVEHFWAIGTKFSTAREIWAQNRNLTTIPQNNWDTFHIYLDIPKPEHQILIEKRTQNLLDLGLQKEVSELLQEGYSGRERPLQSIGYKEMIGFLRREIPDMNICREKIVVATRQLAKAQRTWFKKIPHKSCYHPLQDRDRIFQDIRKFLL